MMTIHDLRFTRTRQTSWFCLGLVVFLSGMASAQTRPASTDTYVGTPWPAADALGRVLPTPDDVGPPRRDRFVGIFYFLWLNERSNKSPHWDGPYDVSRILAADPDAMKKPDSPLWGPRGRSHYWSEPLYGYYLSTDPWVLRRHAHLLADAGIDTLIFDTTNAVIYSDVYRALCEVFREVRRDGEPTPQIAFMVNTKAGETAQRIYDELYKPGLYRELWFHWQGKPLMICDPEQASTELREFFTLRRAHWPFTQVDTAYAWHWEATYPQVYGYTDDPDVPEQVNVSVAQNLRASDGQVTNMSNGDARGRSFHDGKQNIEPGSANHGHNFAEQWRRALELTPPFVMVTGWNEWIAGRWGKDGGPIVFVDQFDQECSRDIEPMKDGHGDNYYWQLVANVRQYKGAPPLPTASAPGSIQIAGGFEQWKDVGPEYRDHVGETTPRDFDGAAGLHYVNRTGRHDLRACKVSRDTKQIYFYLRCGEPIDTPTAPEKKVSGRIMEPQKIILTPFSGLWLLIDIDRDATTGWEGYDYLVNGDADGTLWLAKNGGGWQWAKRTKLDCRIAGRELHLAIPRKALGLPTDTTAASFDFKWADNIQKPGDIMDFYLSGDVAPEGRFNYRYASLSE